MKMSPEHGVCEDVEENGESEECEKCVSVNDEDEPRTWGM